MEIASRGNTPNIVYDAVLLLMKKRYRFQHSYPNLRVWSLKPTVIINMIKGTGMYGVGIKCPH